MARFLVLLIYGAIHTCTADTVNAMRGHLYGQMNYNFTGSLIAQLSVNKKLICASRCAHQFPTCNTAIFDTSMIPQCLLSTELVIPARLVVSTSAVVYDFQQSKFIGMRSDENVNVLFVYIPTLVKS